LVLCCAGEFDVDWYEEVDTSALEVDGVNVLGNLSQHARYKYLLSLEGHSYWSFRIRQLMHLNSALLHQDLPCHEFWYALLRPYEHYVPISRDLADLRAQLRYVQAHDGEARRMVGRMQRLARRLLSQRAVLLYVRTLLTRYAALLKFKVHRHPRAVPLVDVDW
jgi:EGF-domain serine glucosyl/xylosyltransferase